MGGVLAWHSVDMRLTLALGAALVLTMTSCSGEDAPAAAPAAPTVTVTETAAPLEPLLATCRRLILPDGEGPLYDLGVFLTSDVVTSAEVAEADLVIEDLREAAATAQPELAEPLEILVAVGDRLVAEADDPEGAGADGGEIADAARRVTRTCGPLL